MYGKQTLLSKLSTMAYLTMVVLLSWQLLLNITLIDMKFQRPID